MALEDFAAQMDRCSQCSYCKWIPFDQMKSWRFAKNCPSIAYHNFNSYSARGRYAVGRSLIQGQSAISEAVIDVAFTCLTCGACDVACKVCRYNLEPLEMVRELKAHVVEAGHCLDAHLAVIDSLNREANSMQQPRARRAEWADGLDVPRAYAEPVDVLFHAGCRASYDPGVQAGARAAVEILQRAGVKVGIMGEQEMCCAGRVYAMGYREDFERLARANIAAWAKAGVKTLVTSCSDGYHAFKHLYPALGSEVQVLHIVEYLAMLLQEGRLELTTEVPLTVTYHDPCHLGRQGEPYVPWDGVEVKIKNQIVVHDPPKPRRNGAWGVYDEPRHLLRAIPGLELVEMERIREYSWCCGAGGGVREAYPDYSNWTASERVFEAESTGAEALVTACPWCERNFLDAIDGQGGGMQVYDIVELVHRAL